jgi:uncharacterized protein (TIGR02996 family)
MNTASVLLDDIRNQPEDLPLRLILADWLEDNSQEERAEFVRLSCQASVFAPGQLKRAPLDVRAGTLLADHRQQWEGALPSERIWWNAGTISLRFTHLQELADAPFETWAEDPAFDYVTDVVLDLQPCQIALDSLTAFASIPNISRVTHLYLERQLLRREHLQILLGQVSLPSLRHLSLEANELRATDLAPLRSLPWFARLRSLRIDGGCHLPAQPPLFAIRYDDRLLLAMARGNDLIALFIRSDGEGLGDRLDLEDRQLDDASVALLAGAKFLRRLRTLNLAKNRITARGVEALCLSPNVGKLTHLDLSNNQLGDAGLEALIKSNKLSSLRSLRLVDTNFGIAGLRALVDAPSRRHIAPYAITSAKIDQSVLLQALNGSPRLHLTLTLAGPSEDTLAGVGAFGPLREFSLDGDGETTLTSEQLRRLCQSPGLQQLRSLSLVNVGLNTALFNQLLQSSIVGSLRELNLSKNKLAIQAARTLGRTDRLPNLRRLILTENTMGHGLTALPGNLKLAELTHSGEGIAAEVAFELGTNCAKQGVTLSSSSPIFTQSAALGQYLVARAQNRESVCPEISEVSVIEHLARVEARSLVERLDVVVGSGGVLLLDALEHLTNMDALRRFRAVGYLRGHLRQLARISWFTNLTHVELSDHRLQEDDLSELISIKNWQPTLLKIRGGALSKGFRAELQQRFGNHVQL